MHNADDSCEVKTTKWDFGNREHQRTSREAALCPNIFGWSKAELTEKLTYNAHEVIVLPPDDEVCYIEEQKEAADQRKSGSFLCRRNKIRHLTDKDRCRMQSKKDNGRQWIVASYPIFIAKQIIFMRC